MFCVRDGEERGRGEGIEEEIKGPSIILFPRLEKIKKMV